MNELRSFYPSIEPYESGLLSVGDGHEIYFERCGKKGGKPTVFVHGGPGGGSSPIHRSLFNPDIYDIMVFDQRGCGRSKPYAELEYNTTWHLVEDLEKLRVLMEADKWQVFGGSWGSTLSLAYAEKYPERVSELILRGIYMLSKSELDWYYQFGVSEMHPEKWEKFIAPIPEEERHDLIAAYRKRLTHEDTEVQLEAAKAWSIWEGETITLLPDETLSNHFSEGHFALAFARIENHFFTHKGWLEENQLLKDAYKLKGIPGAIIHGRYDMPCPARYAYELHQAWPDADFHMIEGAGHAFDEPGILDMLIRTTDKFANA